MTSSIYKYNPLSLRQWMMEQLKSRGVSVDIAAHVVGSVIETSLRGVDSHGINLFPHYCEVAQSGRIKLKPKLERFRLSPSLSILDADSTFGHHAGAIAMSYAQELASETGFALVNVKNSSHFGSAAYFALRAARDDYIAFAFTNADALVKAHNAKHSFFGTNPICFTAPLTNEEPLCLDMATSSVSWNRIKNCRLEDCLLEPGLAFDSEGNSLTDPHKAVSLAPIGAYKGFGLGMMVEIICSLMTGSPIGKDIAPMFQSISQPRQISHAFIAIDVSKIIPIDQFKSQLTRMVLRIRSMEKFSIEEVMVPGDPEKKFFKQRSATGIPINSFFHEAFRRIHPSIENHIMK